MFAAFAENYQTKYRTDFEIFIKESKLEDFSEAKKGTVLISTIHRSKGREFDNVYMLLGDVKDVTDEEKHRLYVGMTRAKNRLSIHYINNILDRYVVPGIDVAEDRKDYSEPKELILQLSHRDVNLGYFRRRANIIYNLRAGKELIIRGDAFYAVLNGSEILIGLFSKAFKEKLKNLENNDYHAETGSIRFVVLWKGENDTEEIPIVLPDLKLLKQ